MISNQKRVLLIFGIQFLAKHIQNNTVTGEVTNSNWIDIGTLDRLELANKIYKDEN
jgi:NDP-sugar pyrophosphorylase family protein